MLSKNGLSDSKENASVLLQGSTLENLDAVSQLYQKTFYHDFFFFFFFEFVEFSQNRRKEQFKLNSSEHITKEVKQVIQRKGGGTGVAMELLRETK